MKLAYFLTKECPLAVDFNGEKLNLTYRPGAYTPTFEAQCLVAARDEDKDRLSQMLTELIVSWDLTNEVDGVEVPVPTDVQSLRGLPYEILSECITAIVRDLPPNRKTSKDTAAG